MIQISFTLRCYSTLLPGNLKYSPMDQILDSANMVMIFKTYSSKVDYNIVLEAVNTCLHDIQVKDFQVPEASKR